MLEDGINIKKSSFKSLCINNIDFCVRSKYSIWGDKGLRSIKEYLFNSATYIFSEYFQIVVILHLMNENVFIKMRNQN